MTEAMNGAGRGAIGELAPIENQPLRMQIAARLRKAIISGRLPPGAVLVETALAEQMNVSRAPIREAIQLLENDGLVETIAYKGKRVKPLTAREVEETYDLRQVFEVVAVERILDSGVSVDPLWDHCADMEKAVRDDDYEALVAADEGFHRTLIRLSDHHLLLGLWNNLYMRIHQIMALRHRGDRKLAEIAGNHPPIVRALASGDRALATRLISEHTRALAAFDPAGIAEFPE
jgi:DNA-binding GntR family transcriptional regulator